MKKIKICKKLSKLSNIECCDYNCKCLDSEEFIAVDDMNKVINFLEGIKDIKLIKLKLSSMKLELLSQKQDSTKVKKIILKE